MYFWATGALSAFLDNAPTYLVFFNLAGGDAQALMGPLAGTLDGDFDGGGVLRRADLHRQRAQLHDQGDRRGSRRRDAELLRLSSPTRRVADAAAARRVVSVAGDAWTQRKLGRVRARKDMCASGTGPCAPSTIVCSMSPVRDGPEIRLTARGRRPRSARIERERLLHARHDAPRRARRRRACRAAASVAVGVSAPASHHQRAGLGDRAESSR